MPTKYLNNHIITSALDGDLAQGFKPYLLTCALTVFQTHTE